MTIPITSPTLSQQLHAVSGWAFDGEGGYTLGYILRKLPPHSFIENGDDGSWLCSFHPVDDKGYEYKEEGCSSLADTPENAAATTALALFDQHILTKEE